MEDLFCKINLRTHSICGKSYVSDGGYREREIKKARLIIIRSIDSIILFHRGHSPRTALYVTTSRFTPTSSISLNRSNPFCQSLHLAQAEIAELYMWTLGRTPSKFIRSMS
mmetsp:Transcript_25102/g.54111  ORF Transcript_25102/g.54111 Transcript_25102/m.54111 type:complete len:111 (-) Transcript_25102:1813-2145(-)